MLSGLLSRFTRRDPYAHITIDANGLVTAWDEHAAKLFGWHFGQVLNRRLADFLLPLAWRAGHEAALLRLREGDEPHLLGKEVSVQALTSKGDVIDVRLIISRLIGANGQPRYMATLARSTVEFAVLTPEGLVESRASVEKEAMRRRQEEIASLLARAQAEVVIEMRFRSPEEPIEEAFHP